MKTWSPIIKRNLFNKLKMYLKTNRGSLTVLVEFIYSISNKYQHILLTPKLQNKIIPHNIIINYILFNLYIRFQRLKQYFQTKNGNFLSRGWITNLKSTISTERQMKGTGKERANKSIFFQ